MSKDGTLARRLEELRSETRKAVEDANLAVLALEAELGQRRAELKAALGTALSAGVSLEELATMIDRAPGTVRTWAADKSDETTEEEVRSYDVTEGKFDPIESEDAGR